jgi:hypothetical protein
VVANVPPCNPQCADGYISVLLGNGDGTFQSPANFPLGGSDTNTKQLAIADFNLDGKPDVAAVNEHSATISILLNITPFPARKLASAPPPR